MDGDDYFAEASLLYRPEPRPPIWPACLAWFVTGLVVGMLIF